METRSTLCAHSAQIRRAVGALGAWGGVWPSFGEGVRVSGRVRSAAGGAADGAGAGRRYGKPVIHLAVSQFSQPSSQNIPLQSQTQGFQPCLDPASALEQGAEPKHCRLPISALVCGHRVIRSLC